MLKLVRMAAAGLALSLLAAPALAHSTVKSTDPASGSVLPASPPMLTITFNEPARMTSLVVVEAGKPERKLEFMPAGTNAFMAHDLGLANGRNEIKWRALSKDGHPISGSVILVIRSGAAPSAPPAQQHHGH